MAQEIDRINDTTQKEIALQAVGLTRVKVYEKIVEALSATKTGDIVDNQGNVRRGDIPDTARRQWGVEQAIKVFQDDKQATVSIQGNTVNNNTLNIDVSKLSASQLIDLLMGRYKPPIDLVKPSVVKVEVLDND